MAWFKIIKDLTKNRPIIYGGTCALIGYQFGMKHQRESANRALPSGFPKTCSHEYTQQAINNITPQRHMYMEESNTNMLTKIQLQFPDKVKKIVGPNNVTTNELLTGARIGKGVAYCVIHPNTLSEAVNVLQACSNANVAVIPMGKNTSLTGGTTPRNNKCSRPTVVINMSNLKKIQLVGDKKQMLCLAGAGIFDLATAANSVDRESHSILGSYFLNPSVGAGIAFGSGGTQIRKGPAYTERALWCKVDKDGKVIIHNTLGIKAKTNEELFEKIERGDISNDDFDTKYKNVAASAAKSYSKHVCKLNHDVSRYNADTSGIEPCRSEGKVLILATLHDTFQKPKETKTLWVSCNSLADAQKLKKEVLLHNPNDLPIAIEYMDRDSIDIIDDAGRFLCHAIAKFGIGANLEWMWNMKLKIESLPLPFASIFPDKMLYWLNNILPKALPDKIYNLGKLYNHHLIITLGEYGDGNLKRTEDRLNKFCKKNNSIYVHECEKEDIPKVTYFRFSAAPAFKTYCNGTNTQGLSIDYALAKNNVNSPEFQHLKDDDKPIKRMRYSHFGCNVVHEDICFNNNTNVEEVKMKIKKEIEHDGGRLPAEHGHGTEYKAPLETIERWKEMDKLNIMNPGVGGTSYHEKYKEDASKKWEEM